jgi:hypothetical protein
MPTKTSNTLSIDSKVEKEKTITESMGQLRDLMAQKKKEKALTKSKKPKKV